MKKVSPENVFLSFYSKLPYIYSANTFKRVLKVRRSTRHNKNVLIEWLTKFHVKNKPSITFWQMANTKMFYYQYNFKFFKE